jgi:hypothetical protein
VLDRSRQWVEADLQRLIQDQVQESIGLDYKAAAALGQQDGVKREIAKDVSAFANSAGGILLYGMAEDGHRPTNIEPINPNPLSKEWLENVIISNIQPRIDGLHISAVQLTGANAGRVAYVVTIPQSVTAHQAPDQRYYKRHNFQSVPMEDYEVRDTMNRGRTPIIEVRIDSSLDREERERDLHRYQLLVSLENKGAVAAKNVKFVIGFPSPLRPDFAALNRGPEKVVRSANGREYRQLTISGQYMNTIIFPTDSTTVGAHGGYLTFEVDRDRHRFIQDADPPITWIVYADDMAPRSGTVKVASLINY